jgi:quinol monooxygenase YgiN
VPPPAAIDQEEAVIVVRFKLQCQSDRTVELAAAMKDVVDAARELPGVIHFDIARDLTDADALIATEVFEDRAAMEREEALPEVAKVVELMQSGALAGAPEWTVFDVASSESPAM